MDKLPPSERIAVLTKRIQNLNHATTLDVEFRVKEIDRARKALEKAQRELGHE